MTRPIETLTATWTPGAAGWGPPDGSYWATVARGWRSPDVPGHVNLPRDLVGLVVRLAADGWWYAAALGDGAHLFQREAPGP